MKRVKFLLVASVIVIMVCIQAVMSFAKIPEPDNIIFGTVQINEFLLTSDYEFGVDTKTITITLNINSNPSPIASYTIEAIPGSGDFFILDVPIDALDPQEPGTARLGDEATIYINDEEVKTIYISERGDIQRIDLVGDFIDTDRDGLADIIDPDSDDDGLPDDWEVKYNLDPLVNDASANPDGDCFTNFEEYIAGTNPLVPDSIMCKQEIDLCQGWNLISFQINNCYYKGQPPTVFIPAGIIQQDVGSLADWLSNDANSPLRDEADPNKAGNWQRVTSFDSAGAHILDKDLPPQINTLKYMSAGYGYWIKMNAPGTLVLEGQFLSINTPLILQNGWNLIGYIPNDTCYADIAQNSICPYNSGVYPPGEGIVYCSIDPPLIPSVFTSIQGKYRRITSFDCCEGAMIYDTQLPAVINTLHYVGPKYGYWIKIEDTEGAELIFPESCAGIE